MLRKMLDRWFRPDTGHELRMTADNNFSQAMTFRAVLENRDGDLSLVEFGHGRPAFVGPGEKVMKIIHPDIVAGGAASPARDGPAPRKRLNDIDWEAAERVAEDRKEVAEIRHDLAFGEAVMEDTESIAAVVGLALRKFNEMILLFRDFSFRSTTDTVYLRMDGKNYIITIKEQVFS